MDISGLSLAALLPQMQNLQHLEKKQQFDVPATLHLITQSKLACDLFSSVSEVQFETPFPLLDFVVQLRKCPIQNLHHVGCLVRWVKLHGWV